MSSRIQAYLALTSVAAIWGIAAVVIKYTLQFVPPYTFLTYRFWLSFIFILPFFILEYRRHQPSREQLKEIILLTFVGIPVNLILVFLGINLTSALEASFILTTGPIFAVLGGYLFLKENIEHHELIGLLIAILGTTLIVLEPLFDGKQLTLSSLSGNFILIAANLTLAYYTVRSRRDLKHRFSPLFITAIGFIIAPVFLTPLSALEQPLLQLPITIYRLPIAAHLGVWYMALISGIIGYFLFQFGLQRIEASEATLFQYLNPLFGAPLAILWLGDRITTPFLIGAIIVALGVIMAEYRPRRRKHQIVIAWLKKRLSFSTSPW